MNPLKIFSTKLQEDEVTLKQIKQDRNTIYGARAIKQHLGWRARETKDYDAYSNNPRRSAKKLKNKLSRMSQSNVYYTQPAQYPSTQRVKRRSDINRDVVVADFTQTKPRQITTINGINYVLLNEIVKDKRKALSCKKHAYRHTKDKADLQRINAHKKAKKHKFLKKIF